MTEKARNWISQQKALAPDKPFFVYFAPGATHAPHHVPKEWADKYKGKFDAGLGQAARGDIRAAEEARRHPGGLRAHRAPRGDPGLGRDAGGVQAGAAPRDGSLRGLPGVHRPPRRPAPGRAEEARHLRRHARLLHHRRQRRLRRGRDQRLLQRDELLQRPAGPRDARVPDGAARQARRAGVVQPLRRGLGARDEHPLSVDQAGRFALGRNAQRHHHSLAEGDQGQGRDALAVPSRHRRRADDPRGGRDCPSRSP